MMLVKVCSSIISSKPTSFVSPVIKSVIENFVASRNASYIHLKSLLSLFSTLFFMIFSFLTLSFYSLHPIRHVFNMSDGMNLLCNLLFNFTEQLDICIGIQMFFCPCLSFLHCQRHNRGPSCP